MKVTLLKRLISLALTILMIMSVFSMLNISSYAASRESEPNDSFVKANAINVNTNYYGRAKGDDDDYYKFTTTSNGYITVNFSHGELDLEDRYCWYLILYDSNREELYYTWVAYANDNKPLSTQKFGIPAGTYYLEVETINYYNGYGDPIHEGADTDYTLNINFTKSAVWELEDNGSFGRSTRIALNTRYYGYAFANQKDSLYEWSTDKDYFKFTLNSNQLININFTHDELDEDMWNLSLYDAEKREIKNWDIYAWSSKPFTSGAIYLPKGTYYIIIDASGGLKPDGADTIYTLGVFVQRFPDVSIDAWYYNAIEYVANKGYMSGYSNGNFGPGNSLKRQDFVVALANIAKADLSKYQNTTSKLKDVKKGAYYAAAVNWAVDNKIIAGYANGKFGVNDPITREQVATILYRYMKSPSVSGTDSTLAKFKDVKNISSFAKTPMAWAVQKNVISGMSDGRLAPTKTASRAEIASIIMRMDQQGLFK